MAGEGIRILVVDDDHEVAEFMRVTLRTKGYDVDVTFDGEEAWRYLEDHTPDLIVCDLRMPKMSGMELIKRVRANEELASMPILVVSSMTAAAQKPEEFWLKALACDELLEKPFDPLSLLGRVEYLLRRGRYASERPAEPEGAGGRVVAAVTNTPGPGPEEVVRIFVESWNTRDFGREWDALGDEMLHGLGKREYAERRAQTYADEKGDSTTHAVLESDCQISGNLAAVQILREDMDGGLPKRKDERYTLKRTHEGWKIVAVRSRPVTFTIE